MSHSSFGDRDRQRVVAPLVRLTPFCISMLHLGSLIWRGGKKIPILTSSSWRRVCACKPASCDIREKFAPPRPPKCALLFKICSESDQGVCVCEGRESERERVSESKEAIPSSRRERFLELVPAWLRANSIHSRRLCLAHLSSPLHAALSLSLSLKHTFSPSSIRPMLVRSRRSTHLSSALPS